MRENSVAKRYAKALVKSVEDEKEYRDIKGELELFKQSLDADAEFKAGMETLLFSKNQKLEILDSINKKAGFNSKTGNFLTVLADENRLIFLDAIIRMMEETWFETKGIERLKVISAIELNAGLEKKLVTQLENAFDKKIVLEKSVDASLIAGIKIQRGSVFYDFSIEGNLVKLKQSLLSETHPSVEEH